jgi:hypothetical protein
MIMIRSRRSDWREVSKEKAMDYGRKLLKALGYCVPESDQVRHLERFIKGLDVNEIIEGGIYNV